jgi:hypothetical protein
VVRKFFPLDKNYVLEQAQLSLEVPLLEYLVDYVKVQYMLQHNPLGLIDEIIQRIQNHQSSEYSRLHDFYQTLSGIFRYKNYHDNQLTFIFSGEEPYDRYCREWTEEFRLWTRKFCQQKNFIMGVLELTVFYPHEDEARFIGERLTTFVAQQFEVKLHPQKGIIKSA